MISQCSLLLLLLFAELSQSVSLQYFSDPSPLDQQIVGEWSLVGQEMRINGQALDQHFEEVAAYLTAHSQTNISAESLARKFKKGYRGIPDGTRLEFQDNFVYHIIFPDQRRQEGFWKVQNGQNIVLFADQQELKLEIQFINQRNAEVIIQEKRTDDSPSSRQTVMELILRLQRQ